jgi:hypothetical protein
MPALAGDTSTADTSAAASSIAVTPKADDTYAAPDSQEKA